MKNAISFCLFGSAPKYVRGLIENLELVPTVYPGWEVVVYVESGHPVIPEIRSHQVVSRIFEESDRARGSAWRFYAADLPGYDYVIFRDVDSRVNTKEAAAVAEWMASGQKLHRMRDHPNHKNPILGGMFGVRGDHNIRFNEQIKKWPFTGRYGEDEAFLKSIVWPSLKNSCCSHGTGLGGWPTHIPINGYVGMPVKPNVRKLEPVSDCKFIGFWGMTPSVGISHHSTNLRQMLIEAFMSGRTLILPELNLHGRHNNGKHLKSRLTEYFDIPNLSVNGLPIPCLAQKFDWKGNGAVRVGLFDKVFRDDQTKVVYKHFSGRDWVLRHRVRDVYKDDGPFRVNMPVHPSLIEVTDRIAATLPEDSVYVHVRRGDRIGQTRKYTTPEHILKVLKKHAPVGATVYIATNEKDRTWFDPIRQEFDVRQYFDYPELVRLEEFDNYRLFLAERELKHRVSIKISTFKVPKGHGRESYHAYLSPERGWQ